MCSISRLFCTKKTTLLLLFISLLITGCELGIFEKNSSFALREGDLLFQDIDCGPLCDAIEKVTTGCQGANLSHVGIVAKDDSGNFVVIEAVSSGVKTTPLQAFLERSFDTKGQPKVVVGRLKRPYRHLLSPAVKEALALKGKPYDKAFAIDNDAYYCSELIYEIFLQANDNNSVFALQPMTFKDPQTGQVLLTWQEYFADLGIPIPEGHLGINPGGISRSNVLTIVHKYGIPSRTPPHGGE